MNKYLPSKRFWLYASGVAGVLILAMVGVGFWLYNGGVSNAKRAVFSATGLPLGKVGSLYISPSDVDLYIDIGQRLGSSPLGQLTDSLQLEQVAKGKVTVSNAEVARTAQSLAGDATYASIVEAVGEHTARESVAYYYALDVKLRAWYAGQSALEPVLVSRLASIQQRLNSGAGLSVIAAQYSDDTATKWFSGDAGYVDLDNVVWEYADAIKDLPLNTRAVVYTRYGVHVVELTGEVVEAGKRLVRIQEIVLRPEQYDAWLVQQKAMVPVVWYTQSQ